MTHRRPWMPLYIADYREDTQHLSLAEHGAYLLLIMEYWDKGELPGDEKALRQILKISPYVWKKISQKVLKFFDDNLKHKRIEAELDKARRKMLTNHERAQKASTIRWSSKHPPSNPPSNAQMYAWPMHTSHKKEKQERKTPTEVFLSCDVQQKERSDNGGSLAALGTTLASPPDAQDNQQENEMPKPLLNYTPIAQRSDPMAFGEQWTKDPRNSVPAEKLAPSESLLRIELGKRLGRSVSDAEFQRYLETRQAKA